jgi:hypothetical protein
LKSLLNHGSRNSSFVIRGSDNAVCLRAERVRNGTGAIKWCRLAKTCRLASPENMPRVQAVSPPTKAEGTFRIKLLELVKLIWTQDSMSLLDAFQWAADVLLGTRSEPDELGVGRPLYLALGLQRAGDALRGCGWDDVGVAGREELAMNLSRKCCSQCAEDIFGGLVGLCEWEVR